MSMSRNSEVSSPSIEVLQDVTKRVKEVYDILNRERNRVCKEMETQDEKAKKREQTPSSKIKLNIGGHIFLTTLGTLKNAPPGNLLPHLECVPTIVVAQSRCSLILDTSITVASLSLNSAQ